MKLVLDIEDRTLGNELAGEPAETWALVQREYFDLRPLTAREYVAGQQVQSTTSHMATSPYLSGMHTGLRLVTRNEAGEVSRQFNAESVVNVGENNRQLEWRLQEVTPNG